MIRDKITKHVTEPIKNIAIIAVSAFVMALISLLIAIGGARHAN